LFDEMLEKSGYMFSLVAEGREGADRVENVKELASSIAQYEKENEEATLSGFLEEVALISDIDQYDADADAVVLMTIHSAKGLEFENVHLVGMEEGLFPGNQSIFGGPEDIEEERRLAYVAITRAKKRLYISNAYTRMLYGQTGRNLPSRFLDEVPKELCEVKGVRGFSGSFGNAEFRYGSSSNGSSFGWGFGSSQGSARGGFGSAASKPQGYGATQRPTMGGHHTVKPSFLSPAAAPKAKAESFAVGCRVKHKVFGEGMVLSSTPMGNDTLLEIAFDQKGTKKLMANFAKLEKI
jgi:DNA helicase-2/ATP-dependent DNA helicase PcrA